MMPIPRAAKKRSAQRLSGIIGLFLALAICGLLSCSGQREESSQNISDSQPKISDIQPARQSSTIKYDERGRIKGLFGLRTDPSGDPTCRLKEYTVEFINIERREFLVFQLPNSFRVWVKVEGEMQKILSDPQNAQARAFLSPRKKYKLTAYACDGVGHTSYETVSVEALD